MPSKEWVLSKTVLQREAAFEVAENKCFELNKIPVLELK